MSEKSDERTEWESLKSALLSSEAPLKPEAIFWLAVMEKLDEIARAVTPEGK